MKSAITLLDQKKDLFGGDGQVLQFKKVKPGNKFWSCKDWWVIQVV